jgi:protein-disulfide isomerase
VFEQIASDLRLGLPKYRECVVSERSRTAVVKDIEAARRLRIESTPSFVVNGKVINGALSFADFQKIIEQELTQRVTQNNPQ